MFFKLLKIYLKDFSLDRLLSINGSKAKKIALYGVIIYALIVVLGSFGFMFFNLADMLNQMNQMQVLIGMIAAYSLIMPIIMTLLRASGTIFFYKDYDIVAPLPIKPRVIFTAKLTVMYIWMYLLSFIFVLPILFSYFYFAGFSIVTLLIYIALSFVFPIVPIVVMSFLSLAIGYIATKFSFGKLLQIILLFAVFFGIMVLQFTMSSTSINPNGQIDLFEGIAKYYPPITWYQEAMGGHEIIPFLYILLSHITLLILFIFGVEKLSTKINQSGVQKHRSKKIKTTKISKRSVLVILIKKEFNKFFSIPIYALNAGFGLVLLLILSIATFFVNDIDSILQMLELANFEPFMAISIIIGFVIALAYTPAITLSLEGKNFWIIKSLPIKADRVMLSKILFNIVIALPVILVSLVLFMVSLEIPVLTTLILMLASTTLLILVSYINAVVNLYFPKFDFKNEVEIVKQSLSAIIGMLLGLTAVLINGGIFYLLFDHFSTDIILLCLSLVNVCLIIPFYVIIKTKSESIFYKL